MRGEEIAYWDHQGQGIVYVNVDRYSDGSPMVKHVREGYPSRVLLRPRDSAGFLGGIFWVQSLIEQGCAPPELIMPCVFGQRQDRINPEGDTLFTIKSVGKLVNSLGCRRVIILDPHSEATTAAIDRCTVYHADDIWKSGVAVYAHRNQYDAVVAPDAGAHKRAAKIAKLLEIPVKQAWKTRNVSTGALTGFGVEDLRDLWPERQHDDDPTPRVLVVDDLCDGGGTFLGLGEVLQNKGVDADLYVTHGLFTKGTQQLLLKYGNIFCTDSVVIPRPDVTIIKAAEYILKFGDLK